MIYKTLPITFLDDEIVFKSLIRSSASTTNSLYKSPHALS